VRAGGPPRVLDRQQWKPFHEGPGEKPGAARHRHARRAVDFDPGQAAGGGFRLEDIAGEIKGGQFLHPFFRPGRHPVGQIPAGFVGHQAWPCRIALQTHGFPGDAEAALDFRAYGNEFDVLAQDIGDVPVALVAAVVAHGLAEQTGTDSEAERVGHAGCLMAAARVAGWGRSG